MKGGFNKRTWRELKEASFEANEISQGGISISHYPPPPNTRAKGDCARLSKCTRQNWPLFIGPGPFCPHVIRPFMVVPRSSFARRGGFLLRPVESTHFYYASQKYVRESTDQARLHPNESNLIHPSAAGAAARLELRPPLCGCQPSDAPPCHQQKKFHSCLGVPGMCASLFPNFLPPFVSYRTKLMLCEGFIFLARGTGSKKGGRDWLFLLQKPARGSVTPPFYCEGVDSLQGGGIEIAGLLFLCVLFPTGQKLNLIYEK